MSRTLIRAHTLLTQSARHGDVPGGAILVEDDVIRQIGPLAELERLGPFEAELGDPTRHLALPGLVNGHHHSLRPTRIGVRSSPLESVLVRQRLRQVPPLSPEEAYDHTLWGTLQFLKSGGTAVVDHYPVDTGAEDLGVPAAVQAYLDAGVRVAICCACADQQRYVYEADEAFAASLPGELGEGLRARFRPFDARAFFLRWERLAAQYDGKGGRIRLGFGPGGPQWCSDNLLQQLRRLSDEHDHAPIQIHLLESKFQALYGYRRYGQSIVQHLNEIGFFGPGTSCAHSVWVQRDDIRLLAEVGAVAIHNPSSNLVLFSGISPLADLLEGGVPTGFGADAAGFNDTIDLLTDLRLAHLLQRRPGWDQRILSAADMLGVATHGGAQALGMGTTIGRLEAGYQADVVLVDRTRLYDSPYVSPFAPADEVLLRRATADDVEHVVIAGRLVIQDRQAVGIDEAALKRRVRQSLERTYELLESADGFFEQLEPYLDAFFRRWEAESAHLLPVHYQFNTR